MKKKSSAKRVLITGGYGFIGAYVTSALIKSGYHIICAVRDTNRAKLKFPTCEIIYCDFNADLSKEHWLPRLKGIDIVINIVGVLNSAKENDIKNVHTKSTIALFEACKQSKIKKLIHISALGIDDENSTAYSITKKQADDHLKTIQEIDWVILQPSLVYAAGSFGGTSLLRALAALPIIPLIGDGKQEFQPIHVQDLCNVVLSLIEKKSKTQTTIKIAGPKSVTVKEILKNFRSWLGLKPTIFVKIPKLLTKIAARVGDIIGWSTFNMTSYTMMQHGNTTDIKKMQQLTKVKPVDFITGLATDPLTIQSLWHARLYFLKPVLRIFLGLFWFFSGFNCIFLAPDLAQKYLTTLGFNATLTYFTIFIGGAIDIILGFCLLFRLKVIEVGLLQIGVIISYSTILSFLDPKLWLDPLGSLVKNIPVILCTLIMLAIERDK